jgi:hypothetical protein
MIGERISCTRRRLAILSAGFISVATAELTLRVIGFGDPPLYVFDEEIEYYLKPNGVYKRFGQTIRVNRYGMRSDDVDLASVDRGLVFSLYGDSVVYGHHLDQADTPPAQLQSLLRDKMEGAMPVANSIAASSWGPENLLYFYNRFGPFPGNTAWIIQSSHDMIDVTHQVNKVVAYRSSAPYGALHDCALSVLYGVIPWIRPKIADPESFQDKRKRADIALDALIGALKKDYMRVVLVFHATKEEALSGKADGLGHYLAFAKSHSIEFVSTLELYSWAYAGGREPHFDDIHLNSSGAALLAAQLLTSLP